MSSRRVHALFVCSGNRWRSPTAERIYGRDPRVEVRSAGTSRQAVRRVTAADLRWADIVMVMEPKHRERLLAEFPGELRFGHIVVLDILDEYQAMDSELIVELRRAVEPVFDDLLGSS